MRLNHSARTARGGFTITELLVSLALIIFIMSILAQGFSSASKVVTDLRAANDLAGRLRGIVTLLRNDLKAQHLDNPTRRLGDDSWDPAANPTGSKKGFFRIYQVGRPTHIGSTQPTPLNEMV